MMRHVTLALACSALVSIPCINAHARIVRLEITKTEPAFGGRGFGEIGTFERVTGKAHGEVFASIRPATAMVEVSRLIDPDMLVEIEAEAIL